MEETLRALIALGFAMLLIVLRLDAPRFGAAEYDEPDDFGRNPPILGRIAWYVIGLLLVIAVALVLPGTSQLYLTVGDRTGAVLMGLGAGAVGIAQAIGLALFRFGGLRPPPARAYPGAIVNAIGTAVLDEATFRGIVLGALVAIGVEPLAAVLIQAIVYTLATRAGRTGGDLYLLLLDLGIGLVGGWLTVVTGGIGAAIVAHAITRLALFVVTGHAGSAGHRGELSEDGLDMPGWEPVEDEADMDGAYPDAANAVQAVDADATEVQAGIDGVRAGEAPSEA
jgi:membrane protease YdiL (CAAX protease family)